MNRPERAETVRALMADQAERSPDRVFCVSPEDGATLSFGALSARSRRLAARFDAQGIEPGAHVGMLLPNGPQAVQTFVGTMAAGRVIVPLSLIATAEQLAFVIDHSDCVAVFVSAEHEAILRAALAGVTRPVHVYLVDAESDVASNDDSLKVPDDWGASLCEVQAPALLMYTSGTTGRPKGVVLSHRNVVSGARFVSEAHALGAPDRVLAVLPLYHINAQIVTVLAPLYHGGSLVMPKRFSTRAFWELATRYQCTWLNVVPTIIAFLLGESTPPVIRDSGQGDGVRPRFCRSASAPLPPAHLRAFEKRFGIPVVETMGLTETAAPVFANAGEPASRKIGSPGKAFGNETRVIDPSNERTLRPGNTGEIVVRGPNVMIGYYRAPEETRKAFTRDGWLRTGDLGHCDAEGYYFITGRLKELIIKGGENIAPREIDEVLLQHPAVLEAAVVGVPDELYGQDILAAIVLRPGASCSDGSLIDLCCMRLGPFKTPRYLCYVDELPKGPSGKVQRIRLLEMLGSLLPKGN